MKSWEASEDEIKAATLGGLVPGTRIGAGRNESAGRADAFDVGLYIAFPIMILSCLADTTRKKCLMNKGFWLKDSIGVSIANNCNTII
ncbi:hypothetical protein ACHAXH_003268 [Discostella pseudostelligera]